MDENSEIILKKICCTCLSRNRKLFQLSSIKDGVNNFYFLLSHDPEAYKVGFYSQPASLHICWECDALVKKLINFRQQACLAQKLLAVITDGRNDSKLTAPLTRLVTKTKNSYDITVVSEVPNSIDNFIDCNAMDVKTEEDLDNVPLAELRNDIIENSEYSCTENDNSQTHEDLIDSIDINSETEYELVEQLNIIPKKIKVKEKIMKKRTRKKSLRYKTNSMNEKELIECRENRKLSASYVDATFKCESCIIGFKAQIDLEEHNINLHHEKPDHSKCDICLCYILKSAFSDHRDSHYLQYVCEKCDYIAYNLDDVLRHWEIRHRKKIARKSRSTKSVGSKPRRNQALRDKRTPYGYQCNECKKYFENKNLRWKHIQRVHREGFRCHTCGKRFAFRTNLGRHEKIHEAPIPREECNICHKMVRTDLSKVHAAIHTERESYSCATCDKTFVSRASYTSHLKYASPHVNAPVFKYKCSMCDKGYRSRGELRDHENYQHKGHTQHQCPICGKALATRRCIRRHVKRAHEGIKENARDKICQQCGKAFRDKKGLREHEYIHSGERPLSCEVCGCTFRQSASLYTHKKRVHNIHAPRKEVQLVKS